MCGEETAIARVSGIFSGIPAAFRNRFVLAGALFSALSGVLFPALLAGCAGNPPPLQEERAAEPVTAALVPRNEAAIENARRVMSTLSQSNSRSDYASSAAFANFREISLGAIPARRLYRSSHPALPGNPRFPYAQQLAENARVKTVINLSDSARAAASYAATIPWYQSFFSRNTIIVLEMGTDYTDPVFAGKLKAALLFIAANSGPFLIHDQDGTECAGFTAALLEALTGASAEEITADYMISYENRYRITPDSGAYRALSALAEDALLVITGYRAAESVNVREAAEAYLANRLGMLPEEIAAVRARLEAKY